MNEQEFAELAAGHALNALSPDDTRAFETARRQHPEWEHHVTADADTAAMLADSVSDVAPPPALRAALLAQIAEGPSAAAGSADDAAAAPALRADRRTAPAAEPATPRRWGARAWFALAASIAILVGVGWGAVFVSEQLNTPASVVALDQIESAPDAQSQTVTLDDGGEVTAHWSESVGKAVLVSDGLPTIADDQSYELWFVRDGAAISAGTFTADDGAATALLDGAMEAGDVIAVTVEQAGGSPTGQPTSDPIVAIATA
ncbi:Anti-sigma-K factor RskA [Microbacterium sp. cf046]|uniref:anti-sigma factor n=1 Tax=Microbacterium sp. cf046 TaxID=1761803 RepID=UPI0008EDB641|nr:anti-sigma factor [Microbacterium sp. cf046]SFS17195.1 Anti-sigma-K factor RskA [Microbacterium sp. cf046]